MIPGQNVRVRWICGHPSGQGEWRMRDDLCTVVGEDHRGTTFRHADEAFVFFLAHGEALSVDPAEASA